MSRSAGPESTTGGAGTSSSALLDSGRVGRGGGVWLSLSSAVRETGDVMEETMPIEGGHQIREAYVPTYLRLSALSMTVSSSFRSIHSRVMVLNLSIRG
jgi:hypothetical protein